MCSKNGIKFLVYHITVGCLLTNRCKYLHLFLPVLQAQQEMKKEQFDSENRTLTEQIKKLSGFSADLNTLVNTLQTKVKKLEAQVRKLEGEKEALQTEVQVAKTEVCMYSLLLINLPCIMLDA